MTGPTLIIVAAGAAAGAPLRYLVDRALTARFGEDFPWGTLAVNLIGSVLFGFCGGLAVVGHLPALAVQLVGVGFCGAFTTTSAFAWEVVALGESGAYGRAMSYVGLSVTLGLLLAAGGFAAGAEL